MNRHAPSPRRGAGRPLATWWLVSVLAGTVATARADSLVPRGKPAPDVTLTTADGETLQLAQLKGQTVLLLFGELYNPNTVGACKDVAAVLKRPAMAGIKTAAFLIVTQKAPGADLLAQAHEKGVTLPIVHDASRRTFATYRVMVLPSLVVINPKGTTVLSSAGYLLDFQDMVAQAVLFSGGKLSEQEFFRKRAATTSRAAPESHVRALRLAALGEQLARRGSAELAISNFRDALALDPDNIPARLGLGSCLLNRRELAWAEEQFLHVLGSDPESVEASLGLIRIQIIRGGDELKPAEARLRELLRKRPNDPNVVYLAGMVAETSGDASAALGHYKKAAELLLYGQQPTWALK